MVLENLRLLAGLYVSPRRALAGIVDGGSLWFAFLLAAAVASVLYVMPLGVAGAGAAAAVVPVFGVVSTLAGFAILYVPATILLVTVFDQVGSFGVALRRDYAPLLGCTLMSFTAAFLPAALLLHVPVPAAPRLLVAAGLSLAAIAAFATLMVLAVRVVMGARLGPAVAAVALSWLAFLLQGFLAFLASPFFLWIAFHWARGDLGAALGSWGSRQSFKRHLQAATINPQDAEAHYQLGLLHLQRQQVAEAAERFRRALAIDPREIDASFQLARIARREGRLEEALAHLERVLKQDPRHAQHEAWREAGAVYIAHGSWEPARTVLRNYVDARPYDPEGLYLLATALRELGDEAGARELLTRCVEAARTAPDHRRREVRPWLQKAEQDLRRG